MSEMWKENRRMLVYLVVSNFMLFFGFRVWQAMFNNFAVEEMGVGPGSIGWIQAVRELPGLMGFLVGFLALFLSEVRIMALSVILLGVGTFLTGQATNIPFLLVSTVVMSFGFHFFYFSKDRRHDRGDHQQPVSGADHQSHRGHCGASAWRRGVATVRLAGPVSGGSRRRADLAGADPVHAHAAGAGCRSRQGGGLEPRISGKTRRVRQAHHRLGLC